MKKILWTAVLPFLLVGVASGGSCIVSGSTAREPAETVPSDDAVEVVANCSCIRSSSLALFDARDVFTLFSPAGNLFCTPTGFYLIFR